MFTAHGIVYGGTPQEQIKVSSVKVLEDGIMLITFCSGETRLFDASVLQGEVFEPLKDPAVMKSAYVDHGIVCWNDGNIDCAPEFMYENSYEYQPKVKTA